MKLPGDRGVIAAFVCGLIFYIISLIAFEPALSNNELFKNLATVIVTSAFIGGVIAFYLGNSKSNKDDDQGH